MRRYVLAPTYPLALCVVPRDGCTYFVDVMDDTSKTARLTRGVFKGRAGAGVA
jgi:hypothetical protein